MSFIQPVPLRLNINLDGFATYYYSLIPNIRFTTEVWLSQVMSSAGTIQNVGFTANSNPGVGTGWTFTLRKNGADTAITFTIINATSGSDTTHTVSFVAGDYFDWKVVPTNTPVGFSLKYCYFELVTAAKECMYFSSGTYTGVDVYGGFSFNLPDNAQANVPTVIPADGTVTAVRLSQVGAGTSGSFNFILNKNGTDQDGTGGTVNTACSLSLANGSSITFANATFSLPVTAGDLLYIHADAVSSPSASKSISYCYTFVPTGDAAPVMCESGGGTMGTAAATEYMDCISPLPNAGVSETTPIDTPLLCSLPMNIGSFYVRLSGAPGATKTRTFSLRKNAVAQTLSIVVTGAAQTTGNDTAAGHKVRVNSGDTIGIQDVIAASSTGVSRITYGFGMSLVGGGKGAGGGSSGGKGGKGGGLNVQTAGGASFLQIGNPGLDIGITS